MIKETLKNDLQSLICSGNVAKLPTSPLNNYPELKKTLVQACGKYNKNAFTFPYPAAEVVSKLINGENTNFKKDFQFFPTPPELAKIILNDVIFDKPEITILEPSAGHGIFVDLLLEMNQGVKKIFDLVELSDLNVKILREKYKANERIRVVERDFLDIDFAGKKYDLIVANPPFTKNQDIDHIKKMYSLLSDGGQLLTISSASWTFGSQKKQIAFREWLDDLGAVCVSLESGTFKSSGTNTQGMYVNISK